MEKIDKVQVRMLMRKCYMDGVTPTDAFKRIHEQYGNVISRKTIQFWFRRFKFQGVGGDLNDNPRRGRPASAIDLDEFKQWIISNPKETKLAMREHFQCCKNTVHRAIKALKLIEVEGVWIVPVSEDEGESEKERPPYETEVVQKEFTLEQKIFIVASYYESGRKYDKLLDEFERKFDIKSIEFLVDASMTVVQMFESAGSVTDSASFYTREKKLIKKERFASDEENNGAEGIIKPHKLRKRSAKVEYKEPPQIKDPPIKKVRDNTTTRKALKSFSPKPCTICEKMISASNYKDHLRTHGDERPFQCQVCQMAFKLKKYLLSHKKKHIPKDQRPVTICQICGQQSTSREMHLRHMKTHERESIS